MDVGEVNYLWCKMSSTESVNASKCVVLKCKILIK